MYACGLRISEATTLEVGAVDRANQVLRIVGKGDKERLVPRARHRFHQMMRAHLQKAAVVLPVLANKDRVHRRLHVVVDAARAGALEEKCSPRTRG